MSCDLTLRLWSTSAQSHEESSPFLSNTKAHPTASFRSPQDITFQDGEKSLWHNLSSHLRKRKQSARHFTRGEEADGFPLRSDFRVEKEKSRREQAPEWMPLDLEDGLSCTLSIGQPGVFVLEDSTGVQKTLKRPRQCVLASDPDELSLTLSSTWGGGSVQVETARETVVEKPSKMQPNLSFLKTGVQETFESLLQLSLACGSSVSPEPITFPKEKPQPEAARKSFGSESGSPVVSMESFSSITGKEPVVLNVPFKPAASVAIVSQSTPLAEQQQLGTQAPGTLLALPSGVADSESPSTALVVVVPPLSSPRAAPSRSRGKGPRTSRRRASQSRAYFMRIEKALRSLLGISSASAAPVPASSSEAIVSHPTGGTPPGTPSGHVSARASGTKAIRTLSNQNGSVPPEKKRTSTNKRTSRRKRSPDQKGKKVVRSGRIQKGSDPGRIQENSDKKKYKGVNFFKRTRRWEANLWNKAEKKQEYLGSFFAEEKAARAYDRATIYFEGVDAELHFPLADYAPELQQLTALTKRELLKMLKKQSRKEGTEYPVYPR